MPQVFDRIEYGYDVLANLTEQRRVSGNVVNAAERYTFDTLQRLKSSTVTGSDIILLCVGLADGSV